MSYKNGKNNPRGRHGRSSGESSQAQVNQIGGEAGRTEGAPAHTPPVASAPSGQADRGGYVPHPAAYRPATAGAAVQRPKRKRATIIVLVIILAICLLIAAAGFGFVIWQNSITDSIDAPDEEYMEETVKKAENPIDFAELQAKNPDIYAWIYVPNTGINYPILQSPTDDSFYLDHNADGAYSRVGTIYTEMVNSKDFSDPVTVIYGHTFLDKSNTSMFSNLHYFENPEFFAENRDFYIYTPHHILKYEILSAFQYDNRHIMNSFKFYLDQDVTEFYETIANPDSLVKNTSGRAAPVAGIDRVVVLSTCTGDQTTRHMRRYLVTGVLADDTETE